MPLGIRSLVARLTTTALALGIGSTTRSADAEPGALATLELQRSSAAEHCMDARSLAKSVEARLSRPAFANAAPLHLRVLLDRRGSNWVAELDLSDDEGPLGQRELSTGAPHCSALDESLALVVALLVDTPPERPAPTPELQKATAPASPPVRGGGAAPPRSTPLRVPADTWAPRAPWQWGARAGGSLLLFALPGAAYGPSLGAGARPPRGPWLRFNVDWLLPTESRSADGTRGVRVSSQRLGLLMCGWSLGSDTLEWQFCAGQRVGRVSAEGLDFDYAQRVDRLYLAAMAGGELSVRLGSRLFLPLGLFAEIPLTRDQFVARDATEPLHRVAPVALAGTFALEFRGGS